MDKRRGGSATEIANRVRQTKTKNIDLERKRKCFVTKINRW